MGRFRNKTTTSSSRSSQRHRRRHLSNTTSRIHPFLLSSPELPRAAVVMSVASSSSYLRHQLSVLTSDSSFGQQGYPIYECNSLCICEASCPNKVSQQGLLAKLEIFRTENKGWAVRAVEPIPRGTFVCEYVGEVLKDDNAKRNIESEAKSGCSYLFDMASHIDNRERGGTCPYMIDATRYGNVSRFINHSCRPNLTTRLVMVESQLAHIGLFANLDIAAGEELSYDYGQKLLPGPCHCGAQNCRGRVY